jgi:ribosomal protein L7/L12
MLCPKCKNPIEDNATVCEWCGASCKPVTTSQEVDSSFLMPIEDVFNIAGRGVVATGRIEKGIVKVGDKLDIVENGKKQLSTTCTGVEKFRKLLDSAKAGEAVGLLLKGVKKTDIKRGMVIVSSTLSDLSELDREILSMSHDKLAAVKLYKDKTGVDLKEAKDYVDNLFGESLPNNNKGCLAVGLFILGFMGIIMGIVVLVVGDTRFGISSFFIGMVLFIWSGIKLYKN